MDKPGLPHELAAIKFPKWVCWLAQDGDGCWWGYEVEPLERDHGWYENEVGQHIQILKSEPPADWRKQLIRVK
jgi:hypothetical protein